MRLRKWTDADVLAEARRLFPAEEPQTILDLLDEYKNNEPQRVRIAILALSKGDIDDLLTYLSAACLDYRDVLMWSGL